MVPALRRELHSILQADLLEIKHERHHAQGTALEGFGFAGTVAPDADIGSVFYDLEFLQPFPLGYASGSGSGSPSWEASWAMDATRSSSPKFIILTP